MPVMKQLRIGSVNYDTVGEASVTQVQTSGTKIATVTIDGTATDLYAPEGGSSVDPASAAPLMDGTAAVGTSTDYARADHVHPTDTSRAAASHTHAIADVTSLQTALDGKQPTLVSGTNIKTINGESILGSGDLTVGGGGSYDYRIDVTVSGSTVTADYNGSTLTEIATAIVSDPATNVLAIVSNADVTTDIPVKASVLRAAYNASWGDMASTVTLLSFEYDDGDDDLYARRTQLAGYGNATQTYRIS